VTRDFRLLGHPHGLERRARVPDANRVSACGNGWTVALTTLMNERVTLGALSADTEGARLQDLVALARRVGRAGHRAIDDPAVRQRLADF
jgi:alkylation response protein AidB-like acyl-CoA dehydrogenase